GAHGRPPLGAIVGRLLMEAPESRFQSAADVRWALEQIPRGRGEAPITARVPGTAGGRSRSRRRRATAMATALLTVLAAVGLARWFPSQTVAPPDRALVRFTWSLPT